MNPGPSLWTTFFYYFAMTIIIGGLSASQALHISPLDPIAVQIGVILGAIAGGAGAYFNRSMLWERPIQGRKAFLNQLDQQLSQSLNMEPLAPEESSQIGEELVIYRSRGAGSLFSGRLYIKLDGEKAELMGRASLIRKLKTML